MSDNRVLLDRVCRCEHSESDHDGRQVCMHGWTSEPEEEVCHCLSFELAMEYVIESPSRRRDPDRVPGDSGQP